MLVVVSRKCTNALHLYHGIFHDNTAGFPHEIVVVAAFLAALPLPDDDAESS